MKIIYIVLLFISTSLVAKVIPIEYFTKKPEVENVKVSPDGKHIAYLYYDKNDSKMAVIDAKTKKGIYSFSLGSDREMTDLWWLNNERVIVENSIITGYLDGKNKNRSLAAVNITGKKREMYHDFNVVSQLKNDPKHFLVSNRYVEESVSLYKFNYYTGNKSLILDQPKPIGKGNAVIVSVSVDTNDIPRIALEYDPQEQENYDDDIYRVHIKNVTGTWESFTFPSKKKEDLVFKLLGMNISNDVFYFLSDYDLEDGGTLGLFKYDLNSKKYTKLFRHPEVDVNNAIRGPKGEIIGVSYDAGYRDYFYVSDKNAQKEIKYHKSIRSSFKNQNIYFINYTQDETEAILYVYSDKNPGDFYIFNREKNKVTYFASRYSKINPKEMASVEPFTIKTRDGLKMYGQMTIPPNKELKNLPMIIYPHGGPYNIKDNWGFDQKAQLFANRGYLVVQLDYRGSGGYGDNFIKAGHGEYGMKMQDDLTDVTLWAINQGYANNDKICIHGISYGGYAVMQGVVREPDLYKCAIADAGIYDIDLQWKKADSFYGGNTKEKNHYLAKMFGKDYENKMILLSPANNVEKIKANILLIHGKQDIRVPIENAYVLEKKFDKIGKKYQTLYKKDGHGFQKEKNRIASFKKILEFLDSNIGSQ